ncbi:MAG TPA: CHAT domain-containing tetratricopeptide repeat protein [Allocoleopsis sp.]
MRFPQLSLGVLIALLTSLTPLSFKFPVPITASQVLAQTSDDRKAEADRLLQQGIEQFQTSQFEATLQSFQQALTIYREIKNRQGEGWALGNLGNVYEELGDYAQAIDYSKQQLAIAREIHDRQSEGAALGNLGLAYLSLGDYAQAIDYQKQHLAIAREIHDRQGEGMALGNLGNAYLSLGDYAQAIDYQKQSLAIAREIYDRPSEGAALGNLGLAYFSLGEYVQAIDYSKQHLAISREIHDRQSEGKALGNLGNAYYSLGDYAQAIDYQKQWLAIAREIHNRQSEGAALGNLGVAYRNLGDYTQAIDYSKQHLAIAREIYDRPSEGAALGNLGLAYFSLGEYAQAIDYSNQWLAIAREIHNRPSEGKALGNLGIAYYSLGDYAQAIDYQKQWLAIAREIHDRESEGKALGNLGLASNSLGDYAQAIDYLNQTLAIAREIHDRQNEGFALNNLGSVLYQSGNFVEAKKTLMEGIKVWESLRAGLGNNDSYKVLIFEEQARTYRTLQKVLIAQNQPLSALEIAERGRARAFVELLARRITTNSKSVNSSITPPTIKQLQQIAKEHAATLVEYSIIAKNFKIKDKEETHESELYIWVIKPTGEVTFRSSDLKPLWQQQNTTLADLVSISRDSIGVRGRGLEVIARVDGVSQTNRLQQLYQLLIQPIADLLPTDPTAHVIFIPQQELFLVPFPALQDASGQYLIQKHTILTAPAIAVLDLTHQRRQHVPGSAQDVLVVGNPTMPLIQPPGQKPTQLKPLVGAEQEAKTIATLFNTQAFTENQATKALIVSRLPNAKIIHLATHGLLDDFSGEGVPGAIALAPSKPGVPNDGLLTSNEILDLKLNAELVVLSACDTGRGKLTGDGVIGLSRSLITAGVPSIIVSLWSIPDAPTAQLMSEFYQNLQKNPDKAIALRQAMLKTMEKYPQPQNWAAFTLIGESN